MNMLINVKFYFLILLVCVESRTSRRNFSDNIKNPELEESCESLLQEFERYEKLYDELFTNKIIGNAGVLQKYRSINTTFYDLFEMFEFSVPTKLSEYRVPRSNLNSIYNSLNARNTNSVPEQNYNSEYTLNANPRIISQLEEQASPVVNINVESSELDTDSSDANSTEYSSSSRITSTDDSEFTDSNSDSDSKSGSSRSTYSDKTQSESDSGSEDSEDCSDRSDSEDCSNFEDTSSSEETSHSEITSESKETSNSEETSDSENSDSEPTSDSGDSSDSEHSGNSSQSDDADFYFEHSGKYKDYSHEDVNQNITAKATQLKITRSLVAQESLKASILESAPELVLSIHLNSNATLPEPSHGIPINFELLLDEKIAEVARTSEERFRNVDRAADLNAEKYKRTSHTLHWGDTPTSPEAIELKEIAWNKKFSISERVTQWASLKNKAAGFFQNQLTLVTASDDGFHISHQEVDGLISDVSMLEVWSEETHSLIDILITAEDARVNWYHFSGNNVLEQLWTWELQEPVTRVLVFRTQSGMKALVGFQPNIEGEQNAFTGLYGVSPWSSWWLEQKLAGGGGGAGAAVATDASYIALAHADGNSVLFYTYDSSLYKYVLNKVLETSGVRCVSAFTSGADSFLAVGAQQSALYLVKNDALVETSVLDYNMQTVDVFMPVKIDYLRNAAILMVQHNLEYGSHSSVVLEALSWNGKHFQMVEHAPCVTHQYEKSPAYGFSCLLEAEGIDGIRGAASIGTNENIRSLLLAGEDHPPLLFDITIEVVNVPDPANSRARHTLETIQHLYEKCKTQNRVLEEMKNKLRAPRRLVGRRWRIRKLSAPAIRIEGDAADSVVIGGKKWLNIDSFRNGDYQRLITFNNEHIKQIVKSLTNAVKMSESPEDLNVPIVFNQGITVHGEVSVEDAYVDTINDVNIDNVLRHTRPLGADMRLHQAHAYLDSLVVNKLFITGAINGINIFEHTHHNEPLVINGDVQVIDKKLNVTNEIIQCEGCLLNDIDIVKDVVRVGCEIPGTLKFRDLEVEKELTIKQTLNDLLPTAEYLSNIRSGKLTTDYSYDSVTLKSLILGGNLKVNYVNGLHWETFENGFIYTNVPNSLTTLHITGKVIAKGGLYINKLNSLRFPDKFISTYELDPISVTGLKTFESSVYANKVKCLGTINGIRTEDVITLQTQQMLGNMSFTNLIINESLNIEGKILGNKLENILVNPTLLDNTYITSNVIFKSLYVNSTVLVKNKFNDTNLHKMASEIFSKKDNTMIIEIEKEFGGSVNVQQGLFVTSNKVSQLDLDELLTTDMNKNLQASITIRQAIINTLVLNGSFAQTNFTDILNNAVYINDKANEQQVHGRISFCNKEQTELYDEVYVEDNNKLHINNLNILNKLNNLKVKNNLLKKDDAVINMKSQNINFQSLKTKNLIVHGSLETNNFVGGVDLEEFDRTRLSKNHDQVITGNYAIKNCTSFGNIVSQIINNYPSRDIIMAYNRLLNLKSDIFAGIIPINYLKVNSLVSNGINGRSLREISKQAIKLNEENTIFSNITFLDPIEVDHLEVTGYFCNEYFPNFIKNVVFLHEDFITIYGRLEYANPLTVTDTLYSKYLNNKNVGIDILQKNKITNVQQQVTVLGDVTIKNNLNVSGFYNNEYISDVNAIFVDEEFYIQGNVYFEDDQRINKLNLNGLINDKYNLKNILHTLVWLNGSQNIPLDVSFANPTMFKSGVNIQHLYNSIDLQKLLDEIIYINSDIYLEGVTKFMEPVIFNADLTIKDKLSSEYINDFSLKEWKENAIFKDKDHALGTQQFKKLTIKGNTAVNYINEFALHTILTSNTDLTLQNDFYLENLVIDEEIIVDGFVNSVNIFDIYSKTLMTYGAQIIQSPIVFGSKVFAKNVTNIQSVNGRLVQNMVPLHTNQELVGTYSFVGKTKANNLEFGGTLNSNNINNSMASSFFTNQFRFKTEIERNAQHGENTTTLSKHWKQAQRSFSDFNEYFQKKSKSTQDELKQINEKINQRFKTLNFFEEIQVLNNKSTDGSNYRFIETKSNQLILENSKNMCTTLVWRWNPAAALFEQWLLLNTGDVASWYSFVKDNHTYLVSSVNSNKCKTYSTIWEAFENYLKWKWTLEPLHKVISVNDDGTMRLQNTSTSQVGDYQLIEESNIVRVEKLSTYTQTNKSITENKYEFSVGGFLQNITIVLFPSKLEVYSQKGLLNLISVENPQNVNIISLNDIQNVLIFTDTSKHIQVYNYRGMSGYVHACTLHVVADNVEPALLYNKMGERQVYLLVKYQHNFSLFKAIMNNVE